MQTKEELAKLYATLSDRKLLDIISDKDEYTEIALAAVYEEIKRRDINLDQVQNYKEDKMLDARISEQVASIELTTLEKMKFFFIWFLPFIGAAFRMNYIEDGLTTKLLQSKIFSIAGFVALILTALLGVEFNYSSFGSISILILFFVLTYLIEKRLRKRSAKST